MAEYLFNVDNGYLEGLLRGFRSGILDRSDYLNLVQCETVEGLLSLSTHLPCFNTSSYIEWNRTDLKLQLQATDYGNFLQNEPSPIPVSVIDDKLKNRLVVEFTHLRNHAVEPLSTFMDYITCV